jgi:hypothetical protein
MLKLTVCFIDELAVAAGKDRLNFAWRCSSRETRTGVRSLPLTHHDLSRT